MPIIMNVLGFFKLIRINNLLIIFFTQWMIRYFLIDGINQWPELDFYLLTLSTILIAAGGYIINDYYDVKIDLINKPSELVVGKTFSRRNAIISHLVVSFFGVFIGLLASWKIALINILCGLLLWLYSNRLKQLPLFGNLAIALLTSLSVIVLIIFYKQPNPAIFVFALYAFFITLIREIIKDIEDMKGDSAFGCQTLPISIGLVKTKYVIYSTLGILTFSYIMLSKYLEINSLSYVIYSMALAMMLAYFGFYVFKADTKKEFTYLSQYTKLIMLVGVLGIAFI